MKQQELKKIISDEIGDKKNNISFQIETLEVLSNLFQKHLKKLRDLSEKQIMNNVVKKMRKKEKN